ncbi:MAG: carboxypeptidase regulatory-like domain-containing protein, partial [Pedobacter sp.]
LQFLPEGGYLVGGLHSLVGFKAIGEDGLGLNIAGKIYDSSGAEAATFASLHNGMGSFEFTPRPDESYTAKITLPEELENEYKLPAVNKEGLVLRLRRDQQSDSLSVEVAASNNAVQLDSTYYLVGTGRGKAYYSTAINFDKPVLKISSKTFPTGVVRFTLLKGRRPLNERIVFVDHNDQLDVKLSANKLAYIQRDSITLDVEIKDKAGIPVQGSFSLAVTDDTQVKPDSLGNYGIGTSLLLNSDLQGKVENPGYYLNGAHADRIKALDNLMLTQGWKGYDWTEVFSPTTEPKFLAEKEFKITGQVTNISKKPVADAQVLISSQKPSFITTTNTDFNGVFTFKDLPQIDSGSFFIQAKTAKGKTKYFGEVTVDRFQPAAIPATFRDQVIPWYVNSDKEQLNYVQQIAKKTKEEFFKPSGISLKQVNIVSKKIIKGTFNRNGPGNADLIFDEKDIKESAVMNLYQLIKQKLPGFRVIMEDGLATLKYNNYMVTIEIDQGPLPVQLEPNTTAEQLIEELSQFKIAGFVGMEVMYSRKYMHKYSRPPSTGSYTSDQIFRSQERVRSLAFESEEINLDQNMFGDTTFSNNQTEKREGNQARIRKSSAVSLPFYIGPFKKTSNNYLDQRINVLTNGLREVAVIGITTSQRVGWHRINKADVVTYRPLPLMKPAAFYSPKYLINPSEVAEPDFRSTILWEPNVTTDANGKAKISFYSADT